MSARAHCQLNRRRRIVKADICDRHHLPVRAGDKRRQSALFFNGLLGACSPISELRDQNALLEKSYLIIY